MENTCKLDFKISICLFRNRIPAALDKEFLQSGNRFAGDEHHPGKRLADYAVQRNQNGEWNQRPEATGHGVNSLFPVKLLHLFVELLLVPCVAGLQFLDSGLEAGRLHGALLAFCHKRSKNQVNRKAEENQCDTVVSGPVIEL